MCYIGDGRLQRREIECVMRACVQESGMELPESDVVALADALYVEAANVGVPSDREQDDVCNDG